MDAEIGKHGDGGAGGSILLDCKELSGRPILEVNGGQGDGKGKGGRAGRISVQYRTGSLTGEAGTISGWRKRKIAHESSLVLFLCGCFLLTSDLIQTSCQISLSSIRGLYF